MADTLATVQAALAEAGATVRSTASVVVPPRPMPGIVRHVADLGALPCWWLEASPAVERGARHSLTRLGSIVLLIIADRPAAPLHLTVTLRAAQRAVIAPPFGSSLVLRRLRRLTATGTRLGDGLAAAGAIDIDAIGRRAFRDIRARITAAREALVLAPPEPDRRTAWLLLQVTRILFLRFVEAEGWLNGQTGFLVDHLDRALATGRDPGRHLLAPLFFGTLNRPGDQRDRYARAFGAVPFLNGGLFDPHPLERRYRWRLPPLAWDELLSPVVRRVEVTLDPESDGAAITPEMLGRILEGLLDPVERKDGGVYYTPPPLVAAMLRDALAVHLAPRLHRSSAVIHSQLDDPDPVLAHALLRLRLLDPAVGSGAFLVEALRLLRGPATDRGPRTRHVLRHALHGIDHSPGAVRITELRLWLELLRTMRGRAPTAVDPLPNLDTAVRGGDALIDPLAGMRIPTTLLGPLRRAREAVEHEHGRAHHRAVRQLHRLEAEAITTALTQREQQLGHELNEAREQAEAPQLFGGPTPRWMPPSDLVGELERIRRARQRLRDEGSGAPFAVESAWPAVLARGGFDLVVGNPPWVRAERLPRRLRDELAVRYTWWRSRGSGWRHEADLAIAFVERSQALLRSGGTLALLLPGKMATTGYAATARAALANHSTLHVVADLQHDARAVFDATTYPLALIASRSAPGADARVRLGLGLTGRSVRQHLWQRAATWPLLDDATVALTQRLHQQYATIGDRFTPSIGVKTGANDLFLDPPEALWHWTRPTVRGRDLGPAGVTVRQRLLWTMTADGRPLMPLPEPLAAYLAPHEARLRRRADQRRGVWWQLFRIGPALSRWRVIWADIAARLTAHQLSDSAVIPLNSCYLMPTANEDEARRLAAWLSVRWIGVLAALSADPAAGGCCRFNSRVVSALPCPEQLWSDPVFGDPETPPELRDSHAADLLGLTSDDCARLAAIAPHRR